MDSVYAFICDIIFISYCIIVLLYCIIVLLYCIMAYNNIKLYAIIYSKKQSKKMNLFPLSVKYIQQHMLPNIIDDKNISWNERDNNTTYVYKSLYKDIQEAFLYVLKRSSTECMKGILNKDKQIKKPELFSDYYMSSGIKGYIEMFGKTQITFTCTILEREVSISFMLFLSDDINRLEIYQKYAEYMYAWLYICIKYSSKKCANKLHVFVYHTPYPKYLPKHKKDIIGTQNINSAYTTSCVKDGEIVVFRKEEWFKVFIHETMHVYGLDFSSYQYRKLINTLETIFPIKSNFLVADTYCETWARIINCAFTSFLSLNTGDSIREYLMYMDILMQIEKFFSIKQAIYILKHMGLTYTDLYSKDEKSVLLRNTMYRESTNVFCYYILTAMFMCDFQGFLSWCKYNNVNRNAKNNNKYSSFIQFEYTEENIDDLGVYIQSIYKSKEFLNGISTIEKYKRDKKDDTVRMSIVEFK